jgi:hypothetical protein
MAAILPVLKVIAVGASIVGTAVSVFGRVQVGRDQAQALEVNAQITERQAQEQERNARIRLERLKSSQRAQFAKAGVDLTSGSPLMIFAETELLGEQEIEAIRTTGVETAAQKRAQAGRAVRAGQIGGATTLLTGLGSTGLDFLKRRKIP